MKYVAICPKCEKFYDIGEFSGPDWFCAHSYHETLQFGVFGQPDLIAQDPLMFKIPCKIVSKYSLAR